MSKVLFVPAGLAAIFAVHKAYEDGLFDKLSPTPAGSEEFDLESKQMYDFDKKETHCPDRDLVHPCTTELTKYLKEYRSLTKEMRLSENNSTYADTAYNCARKVYEVKNDFWTVKNMTHLLLDLDVSHHNFDKEDGIEDRQNRFYNLGLDFGRKLIYHDDCMDEFDSKGEMECRCPMLYGKILLLKLKNAGKWEEAHKLFNELKEFEWNGKIRQYNKGEAFRWHSILQTPQTFIPQLKSQPVWGEERRKDLPIWDVLEDNYPVFLQEIQALDRKKVDWDDAYRFLFKGGRWDQLLLFSGRKWDAELCALVPKTCKIIRESLEARPVHYYPWTSSQNEQVLILRVTPGTDVETHSGPANNILNIHLGVSGLKNAVLVIAGETYGWDEGKVIPWDGSYDHSIHCKQCTEDRVIIMVRYMHPDMEPSMYKGSTKTAFEDIPQGFSDSESFVEDL